MRNIINISLPEVVSKEVRREVKKGGYASTSEFFRHLFRAHKLASELKKDKKAFEMGKGKVLRSLKSLR